MSRWIWYPGEFEIYHSNLVHSRREDYGFDYPTFWMQPATYPRVNFQKTAETEKLRTITVCSRTIGECRLDGARKPLNTPITIPAGQHTLKVLLFGWDKLPAIFIEDAVYGTDETWLVSNGSENYVQADSMPNYTKPTDDPCVFPFAYEDLTPTAKATTGKGLLLDYGKETFGPITLKNCDPNEQYLICYGESKEESLDPVNCTVRESLQGQASYKLRPRAFRYIYTIGSNAEKTVCEAKYEYLPLTEKASFCCDDDMVKQIWDVCVYTFRLNCREFYQDGIKRDRWVWSGDSYQSLMTNSYLFFDHEITKRTIRCLLGKPPYEQHVNTINDYTLYLLMSIWDYYYATGDREFVKSVWHRAKELFDFVQSRLDEHGQMVERKGDWIFIDWSPMDKNGPLCAEQILLWACTVCMGRLAELAGEGGLGYEAKAEALKTHINECYWSEEKQAYIDCYTDGQKNVTRHGNIFAILYDFCEEQRKQSILQHVLFNDEITKITTPYFTFFELCALCKMGNVSYAQEMIRSYWGGMLENGATSIWEYFDPKQSGEAHYEMYGDRYGKSLCHAWGGGPIYLLGRFCAGVRPTSVGYETFTVSPNKGIYKSFRSEVPVKDGRVLVNYENGVLTVETDRAGGTLTVDGRDYILKSNKPINLPF